MSVRTNTYAVDPLSDTIPATLDIRYPFNPVVYVDWDMLGSVSIHVVRKIGIYLEAVSRLRHC